MAALQAQAEAEAMAEHEYRCDHCGEAFQSPARTYIMVSAVLTHDAEGLPARHKMRNAAFVWCPDCTEKHDPVGVLRTDVGDEARSVREQR